MWEKRVEIVCWLSVNIQFSYRAEQREREDENSREKFSSLLGYALSKEWEHKNGRLSRTKKKQLTTREKLYQLKSLVLFLRFTIKSTRCFHSFSSLSFPTSSLKKSILRVKKTSLIFFFELYFKNIAPDIDIELIFAPVIFLKII